MVDPSTLYRLLTCLTDGPLWRADLVAAFGETTVTATETAGHIWLEGDLSKLTDHGAAWLAEREGRQAA